MLEYRTFETPWGFCGFVAGQHGVRATYLPARPRAAVVRRIRADHPQARPNDRLMPALVRAMTRYFQGKRVEFDVPLDLHLVPEFRRRVMEVCRKIPPGKTATYADLARMAGNARAVRAAGSAMANNPLPLLVPCHRVVRSDGTIGGFSSPEGVRQKRRLLAHEGADWTPRNRALCPRR